MLPEVFAHTLIEKRYGLQRSIPDDTPVVLGDEEHVVHVFKLGEQIGEPVCYKGKPVYRFVHDHNNDGNFVGEGDIPVKREIIDPVLTREMWDRDDERP